MEKFYLEGAECLKFVNRYCLNALGGPLQLVFVLVFNYFFFYCICDDILLSYYYVVIFQPKPLTMEGQISDFWGNNYAQLFG